MPDDGTILGRRTGWLTETGTVLALAALVLPVLVLPAALGFGAATVRAAANETQRTADLAAVAAAATLPTLGRPQVLGLPTGNGYLGLPGYKETCLSPVTATVPLSGT